MSEHCLINELKYVIDNNRNLGDIYNIFKKWFCDKSYSPSGVPNFFQELASNAIICNHRTDPNQTQKTDSACNKQCPISTYNIIYNNNNLSSEPSKELKEAFGEDVINSYTKLKKIEWQYLVILKVPLNLNSK